MAEHLTEEDVRGIAEYTRIGLEDDEVTQMIADLNAILDGFDVIEEYDLADVEPTFHPIGGLSNVMREDKESFGLTREAALSNAPARQDGSFLIPSILGASPEGESQEEAGEEASEGADA